jgi:hypothetical protein
MEASDAPMTAAITAAFLDTLAESRSTDEALREIDQHRKLIAKDSIFSIQQNVTTAQDAAGEILLRRYYSSEATSFPVNGSKRKTLTPWTHRIFVQGRPFVGEGEAMLAQTFDDFEQMSDFGLRSVINVPLMQGPLCYATFNVFGTRVRWRPQEVLSIRLLALAAARWVPSIPDLAYRFAKAAAPEMPCL